MNHEFFDDDIQECTVAEQVITITGSCDVYEFNKQDLIAMGKLLDLILVESA